MSEPTTPATTEGPYKAEKMNGVALIRVGGPSDPDCARVFTTQDAADKYAEHLNIAYSAGRAAADAELVEALTSGLHDDALECPFIPTDDPSECYCGASKSHHWKVRARTALAKHTGGKS